MFELAVREEVTVQWLRVIRIKMKKTQAGFMSGGQVDTRTGRGSSSPSLSSVWVLGDYGYTSSPVQVDLRYHRTSLKRSNYNNRKTRGEK
jgi:hypothetical protein